jgi:putative glutamine amidotransferase
LLATSRQGSNKPSASPAHQSKRLPWHFLSWIALTAELSSKPFRDIISEATGINEIFFRLGHVERRSRKCQQGFDRCIHDPDYNQFMRPRIAIAVPHSGDPDYAARALPQYADAVDVAGGEPISIPLDQSAAAVTELIQSCHAVLLPGSKADVDPAKYGAPRHPETAPADFKRDRVDELLLQDAYKTQKPVLGICYGLQILNVDRGGTLLQHIESPVNHKAGRSIPVAHSVQVAPGSRLAQILNLSQSAHGNRSDQPFRQADAAPRSLAASPAAMNALTIPVNSSHHQSAEVVGDGLCIVANCPQDGIVEAVEGTSPEHFVVAVQWHPERSMDDPYSQAILRAFVEAARANLNPTTGQLIGSRKEL